MHSSISNSEKMRMPGRLDPFTVALLIAVFVTLAFTECVTLVGFDRVSKVQRREIAQRKALLSVRDPLAKEKPHVAVLGNSLMLDGVDVSLLRQRVGRDYEPVPYFVLATNYYDWYFGLKRLFDEGMHPRYVLLGLSPNQLAAPNIRGDYSAAYLFQQSDLLEVARETKMDPTTATSFFLAHYSKFYSTREVSRGFLMKRLLPGVEDLLHSRLGTFRDPEIEPSLLMRLSRERLLALDQLCRANGANFLLVVPPTYQKGAETIAQAGREVGVPVLIPVTNEEFDASYYQTDGFHLNEKGTRVFTDRLAGAFLQTGLSTPELRTTARQ